MAEEYRAKGVHVLLGPMVGAMGRVVEGGRNWEGVSPDPYHSGALGAESVQGIQSTGAAACIKVRILPVRQTQNNRADIFVSASISLETSRSSTAIP